MKTFKEYLYEANYMKYLKRNKNLTNDQRKEINTYFSKINTQAGSKIDWQSRKIRDWTYDDFMDLKLKYKSGIKSSDKINCRKIKVPGKEGEDYIRLILKQNDFCAFIPLNHETAQFMNTKKFGGCQGEWCIGDTRTGVNWNDHVIHNGEVPVYVFNKYSKWVVMIQEGNKTYDVWNIDNDPTKTYEGIPGFSIRKNLLTPKLKRLYDEARIMMEEGNEDIEPPEEAVDDYNRLVSDIEDAREEYEKLSLDYYEENKNIKKDTLEKYERILDDLKKELKNSTEEDEKIEIEEQIDDIIDDIERIENMDISEMYYEDDIDWTDDPYSEDYAIENTDWVIADRLKLDYPDYFDYAEEFGATVTDEFREAVMMYQLEGGRPGESIENIFADYGFPTNL